MQVDMNQFWTFLETMGDFDTIVLATSLNDNVTARPIGAIRCENSLLVRTDDDSTKALQIAKNPNVAVCMGPFYMRAKARILGHCTEADNPDVQKAKEAYIRRWPTAFGEGDDFLSGKEVFVLITPTQISQWKMEGENIEGLFHLDTDSE